MTEFHSVVRRIRQALDLRTVFGRDARENVDVRGEVRIVSRYIKKSWSRPAVYQIRG